MQLIDPIEIDLLEFIKTGKFDYIKPGQTKEWILQNFPDPDDKDIKGEIWFYGDIEFHFRKGDTLFMIYSDYIDSLDGGKSLRLRKWIFEHPGKLNFEYVVHNLTKERVAYKTIHGAVSRGYTPISIEVIPSRVTMTFVSPHYEEEDFHLSETRGETEDANLFKLSSIWLSLE